MSKFKPQSHSPKAGFTIIEMLIIAPIVILTIGAFITAIVSMTGEVLATRSANALAYNIQDALNRIEEDVKLSTTFLEANHVSLTSPQGYNNDAATNFANVGANGNMLILNTLATTGNPLSSTSGLVYLDDKPNDCLSTQFNQNTPMTMNVVYFVKNNTLWRRTIAPSNYLTGGGCSIVPWQQPSCTTAGGFCKTQDVRLIDGINASDFVVQYFNTADATAANSVASDSAATPSDRYAALQSTTTVGVTINVTKTAAGREISQAGTIRATKLDINSSTIAAVVPDTTPVAPTVAVSVSDPVSAVFTWPTVPGASTYTIDYNINGGAWVNGFTNGAATTYTVNAARNNVVSARVTATHSSGTSGYGTDSITIPPWTTLVMQNNWSDYAPGWSTGGYTMTSDGMVVLKGLVKKTTGTPVSGEVIGTLPVGYRPSEVLIFETSTNSNVASRVDVYPSGNIVFQIGSAPWLALDGINFLPSTFTFNALTPLLNGWLIYASPPYATPAYATDTSGRVHTKGLIKSGVATDPTPAATLPAGARPLSYEHIAADNSNVHGQIGISAATGTIDVKGGSNSFVSLQAMFYPASYGGWTSLALQNSWTWYGGAFSTPAYTKSADGMVLVKGLIHSGTVTSGTVIANLPVGYRPKQRLLMAITSYTAYGRIDILTTGDIIVGGPINTLWASLDPIAFMAEQ